MNIYYYSHQVYQLSFAIQLYKQLGGFFLVRKLNRKLRLKWYCRKSQRQNAIAKLDDSGIHIPKEILIKIGNPRFDELFNGDINKGQYLKYLGVKDLTRKIILYAPTWKWGNGTLHLYFKNFSRQLSKDYSLIIRPHYFDRKYIPRMKKWLEKREIDNVYISNPANILTNDTMYDIAVSDILISDTSSMTYEYLITQNPIVIY